MNPNAAGIDLGAKEHWVCVPSEATPDNIRAFGCTTPELAAMADWLISCGVTTVAMESTGVEWIPLFQILSERQLKVYLVNAKSVKTVPGRKSDIKDCQWLQQLHSYGLLAPSFVPEGEIAVLRSYLRQRENLVQSACCHVQRMQKALTQMNLQLHKVISDVTGVTGLNIIRGIISGERNPRVLARLADKRIRSSREEIVQALTGNYREEMVFILSQELSLYEFYAQQISAVESQINSCISQFSSVTEEPAPTPKKKNRRFSESEFNLHSHLYRITGVDFTAIDGLNVLTVQTIISEVGLDPSKFHSAKHFASWLGLSPGCNITGGKVKSSGTRKVINRATKAFRLAAQAVGKSHSALGAFYRRIRARLGAPKAITATAHKIARIFYTLWTTKQSYTDLGADYYEQKYRSRVINNLSKKAQSLGFALVEAEQA
ncbi:MAG: IS110 family transposase [Symploca sp. SIO2E6]|nr:IS110 family transposase [Symploca sp. SIO2E6]